MNPLWLSKQFQFTGRITIAPPQTANSNTALHRSPRLAYTPAGSVGHQTPQTAYTIISARLSATCMAQNITAFILVHTTTTLSNNNVTKLKTTLVFLNSSKESIHLQRLQNRWKRYNPNMQQKAELKHVSGVSKITQVQ